eukprot:COSAG05_NODE_4215_length_1618_cov_1.124424_2_plen_244_part_01
MAELAHLEAEEEDLARFVKPLASGCPPVACLVQRQSKSCIAFYTSDRLIPAVVAPVAKPSAGGPAESQPESESDSVPGSAAAMPAASSSEASSTATVAPGAATAAVVDAPASAATGVASPAVQSAATTEYRFLGCARLITTGTLSRGVTFHVYTSSRALHADTSDLAWDGSERSDSKGGGTQRGSLLGFCGKLSIGSAGPASRKAQLWAHQSVCPGLAHLNAVKQAAQAEALALEYGIEIIGTG